jgi:hypothetical protein
MAAPRVFVGMSTRGYAYAPSVVAGVNLARQYGTELALEIGRPIEYVRTRLVSRFLESGADYLLTIDDDVVAPEGTAERLLALNALFATAPCPVFINDRIVSNVKLPGEDDWLASPPHRVFPVRQSGLGFVVIHRDVFTRMRKPWFQLGAAAGGRIVGDDVWFSNGVTQAGIEILCDGSIRCSHFKDGLDLLKLWKE